MLEKHNEIIKEKESKITSQYNKGMNHTSNYEDKFNGRKQSFQSEDLLATQFSKVSKILTLVVPGKAAAITLLSAKFYKDNPKIGNLESLLLATELLHNKDDNFCSTVATLLDDGWGGSVGELLECAREL